MFDLSSHHLICIIMLTTGLPLLHRSYSDCVCLIRCVYRSRLFTCASDEY